MAKLTTSTYLYILEVESNQRRERIWQWAIRRHSKLIQRSDRALAMEAKVRAQGTEMIEKMLHGRDEGRH